MFFMDKYFCSWFFVLLSSLSRPCVGWTGKLGQPCAPGLIPHNNCSCQESSFRGLITCGPGCPESENENPAIIIRGGWIGNYSGEIVGGTSVYLFSFPTNAMHHNASSYGVYLPSNWSKVDQFLCGKLNRTGTLCGNCIDGYSPTTRRHHFKCVKCTDKDSRINWFWYLWLEYVPLTIMFFILVTLNLNTTSGAGNAFIIFSQLITSVFDMFQSGAIPLSSATSGHTQILQVIYQLPYGIWNMEFFSVLVHPFCLSNKIGTYGVILVDYAIALYPVILIVVFSFVVWLYGKGLSVIVLICRPVYKCVLRIQKKWHIRRSIVGVFATFITMSYTKMLLTSCSLVNPTILYNITSHPVHRNVPSYNGNVRYTDPGLIIMYIVAIIILFLYSALLPLLLMTPSFVGFLHRKTGWKWLSKILPWGKMLEFLEGFHSCYTDGSEIRQVDYRWFSGVFLVLRSLFFLTYIFAPDQMMTHVLLSCLCFLTAFTIVYLRPFKVKNHNMLNMGVFCILGIVSCLNSYNTYQTIMWYKIHPILFWFEYLLALLPLALLVIKLLKLALNKYKKARKASGLRRHRGYQQTGTAKDKELKNSLKDDPVDFLAFTEDTGRLKSSSRDVTWYVASSPRDDKDDNDTNRSSLTSIHDGQLYQYGTINC